MKSSETTGSANSTPYAHFERTDRHILPFVCAIPDSSGRNAILRVDHLTVIRAVMCHVYSLATASTLNMKEDSMTRFTVLLSALAAVAFLSVAAAAHAGLLGCGCSHGPVQHAPMVYSDPGMDVGCDCAAVASSCCGVGSDHTGRAFWVILLSW